MLRRIIAAALALAAFAAVPAVASASPVLTDPKGAVAVGSKITGVLSETSKFTTGSGNVECTAADLTGQVTENSGTSIKGEILTASFTGDDATESRCTSTIGDLDLGHATFKPIAENLPWCISSGAKDTWTLVSCKAGQNIAFTFDVFNHTGASLGTCKYERASVAGTFTTGGTTTTLTVGAKTVFNRVAGTFCPAEGELDMKLTIKTEGTSEWIFIS
jgi:hypothetical protein